MIARLVEHLALAPHPEGGFYREIWRSAAQVQPADGRGARAALTVIDFLLPAGSVSRWHRVRSDEVWQHTDGDPLELLLASPEQDRVDRVRLGPRTGGQSPVHVVPAGWWQAARPLGAYALVNCSVAPGFDFVDFDLLSRDAERSVQFCRRFPEAKLFL